MFTIIFSVLFIAFVLIVTFNPIIRKYSDGHYYLEYLGSDGVWKATKLF